MTDLETSTQPEEKELLPEEQPAKKRLFGKKEKKKKGRIWVPLLLLLLGLSVPGRVQAAGNGCELTIPVEIEAKGGHIPGKKEYHTQRKTGELAQAG